MLYQLVPNRPVKFRYAAFGAAFSAILFEVSKQLFSLYITHFPTYQAIYGALATVPILIVWIYLSWLIVLAGAEMTVSLEKYRLIHKSVRSQIDRAIESTTIYFSQARVDSMIGLIQRVSRAQVDVDNNKVGGIDAGLLILGVERGDNEQKAKRLAERIIHYRVFTDAEGKMNQSLVDKGYPTLVVSHYARADTRKGRRPSFSSAAHPSEAQTLYHVFCDHIQSQGVHVETGQFGADMQVSLVNDGPVTFELRVD